MVLARAVNDSLVYERHGRAKPWFEAQVDQVFRNPRTVLQAAGADLDAIVRITV